MKRKFEFTSVRIEFFLSILIEIIVYVCAKIKK